MWFCFLPPAMARFSLAAAWRLRVAAYGFMRKRTARFLSGFFFWARAFLVWAGLASRRTDWISCELMTAEMSVCGESEGERGGPRKQEDGEN